VFIIPLVLTAEGTKDKNCFARREIIFFALALVNSIDYVFLFYDLYPFFSLFMGVLVYSWSTRDLKSQGRFSIESSGYTNMKISAGVGGSKLDARGGIIGGCIELQQLNTEGELGFMPTAQCPSLL